MILTKLQSFSRPAVAFLLLLLVWWALTAFQVVSRSFLPGPPAVWEAFLENLKSGKLADQLGISVGRLVFGYSIGSILGIVIGVLMGLVPGIGRFFRPLLNFFNSLSGITWLPLAIAWFGIGDRTIAFLLVNAVFFVVLINTLTGVQSVPRVYENALLTLGASPLQIVRQVLIPGAMPSIITGLRIGAGFAWRALIAAEMVVAAEGIGFMVFKASYDFRQDILLAGILVIGFVALTIDRLFFEPLERRTIERWGLV